MSVIRKKPLPLAKPEDFEGVTLMRMRSENIMRVRLVDISPTETLTLVGGDNGNGKTSFFDSLGICLGGKEAIPADPIHHGTQQGSITCDFGDGEKVKLTVHCTIKKVGDADWVSEVELDIPGHIPPSAVQTFLRKLIGRPSFDPMVFDLLPPAEQFETMQAFVAGFDFKKHAKDYQTIYDRRRDIGRDQAREQSAASSIVYAEKPPAERVDENALQEELVNTQARLGKRERANDQIAQARQIIAGTEAAIAVARADAEAARDREVARLEELIAAARKACDDKIARDTEQLRAQETAATAQIEDLEKKLREAKPLRAVDDIGADLTAARTSNQKLRDWQQQRDRHAEHQKKADDFAQQYNDLTAQLDTMDAAKAKAIRESQMPVEGLGFADGFVTMMAPDGKPVPWSQASMAQRVDASCAIAMAMNPKIKVILIRNGSNLGKTIRERIRQRAAEKGYRVLMEVVEEGAGTHVVIEDGVVKGVAA
jgi:hypothetical protein